MLSVSVSTLPTSDEDDQDPNVESSLEPLQSSIVDLIANDEKRGPSRSLKRSHIGEDTRPPYQPYRQQRTRCTQQIRELEVQYEISHTPALLNTPGGAPLVRSGMSWRCCGPAESAIPPIVHPGPLIGQGASPGWADLSCKSGFREAGRRGLFSLPLPRND